MINAGKAIVFLLSFIVLGFVIWIHFNNDLDQCINDDSINMIRDNLSTALGEEWALENLREIRADARQKEDMKGRSFSICQHVIVGAHHQANGLAFARQHIIYYGNVGDAQERFNEQIDWVFVRKFGVPRSRQIFSYEYIDLPRDSDLSVDDVELACIESDINIQCGAFLRQQNIVVYLDVFLKRNNVQFLSDYDFMKLVFTIDNQLTSGAVFKY